MNGRDRRPAAVEAAPPDTLFWIEQVVAHIPYDVRHLVTIERLQPQPARLVRWEAGPVHATTRLLSDGEAVEITFVGSVNVTFVDHEGETCQVRRPFTVRREFLPVEPIPPHGQVRALALGTPGEGTLVPASRPAGFRGHLHLHAWVTVTKPVLRHGIPGQPVTFAGEHGGFEATAPRETDAPLKTVPDVPVKGEPGDAERGAEEPRAIPETADAGPPESAGKEAAIDNALAPEASGPSADTPTSTAPAAVQPPEMGEPPSSEPLGTEGSASPLPQEAEPKRDGEPAGDAAKEKALGDEADAAGMEPDGAGTEPAAPPETDEPPHPAPRRPAANVLVWRLPQGEPVGKTASPWRSTSRPGSKDGSR